MMRNKIINKNFKASKIITCDNVKVCVGLKKKPTLLIDNFNYSFEEGKIYSIIGNSGTGKSTLISHISGLIKPRFGNVYIKDQTISEHDRKVKSWKQIRKLVGVVFQFPEHQIFKDTVEKDISYGPINYGIDKAEASKIASKYLSLVGLPLKLLKANPFELSNGQKRLVAIAGILALETDVVIFDEPTAGLDSSGQKKIINIIKKLSEQGKTIIIVTHNMDNVLELSDQVLVLNNGFLLKTGNPYEIFSDNEILNKTGFSLPHVFAIAKKYPDIFSRRPRCIEDLVAMMKERRK